MADDTERHVGPGDQAVPPLRRFCEGLVAAAADPVDEDTGPRTDAVPPGWTRVGREPGSGSGGCSGTYSARIAEAPGSQSRHPWRSRGRPPVASMEPVDQDARGAVRFPLPPGAAKDRRTPAGRGPSDEGFLKQLAVLLFPRRGHRRPGRRRPGSWTGYRTTPDGSRRRQPCPRVSIHPSRCRSLEGTRWQSDCRHPDRKSIRSGL